jgi:hypothetical protein
VAFAEQRARELETREHFASRQRAIATTPGLGVAALLLLLVACNPEERRSVPPAGEWLEFGGSWTATGTRRSLKLGPERRAAVFELSGSLQLTGEDRPAIGFKAQAIGLSDSASGLQGRAVWTDERSEQVYSELRGEMLAGAKHITGTITSGTGRYAGISGEYGFEWQYVLEAEDGSVSGRAVGLEGRARLAPAADAESRGR